MAENGQKTENKIIELDQHVKKKGPGRKILYAVTLVLLAAIGVAGFVFADDINTDGLTRLLTYFSVSKNEQSTASEITFSAHSKNSYGDLGGCFVLGSVGGLDLYALSGELKYSESLIVDKPVVITGGGLGVVYDLGGRSLLAFNQEGQVSLLETDFPILNATVNGSGWVALTTQENGYKSLVTVYDSSMSERYKFYSASKYVSCAYVSPDNQSVTAVTEGVADTRFVSELLTYRLDSEEVFASHSIPDQVVLELKYVSDDTFCVVCENELIYVNQYGEQAAYDFTGQSLEYFDISSDGYAVLVLQKRKAGNNAAVVSISKDGTVLGSIDCNDELLSVSTAGDYVGLLTAGQLNIYDSEMKPKVSVGDVGGARQAIVRDDGTAFIIFHDHVKFYIP